MGGVIEHDRLFMLDPPWHLRANNVDYEKWLRKHPGPIYTSDPSEVGDYPGLVQYPLEEVLNAIHHPYLDTTVAGALAFAIYKKVPVINLFGCDFNYQDRPQNESGRACVEFLLGIAFANGVQIKIGKSSTLLDTCVPSKRRIYGFKEKWDTDISQNDGSLKVEFKDISS